MLRHFVPVRGTKCGSRTYIYDNMITLDFNFPIYEIERKPAFDLLFASLPTLKPRGMEFTFTFSSILHILIYLTVPPGYKTQTDGFIRGSKKCFQYSQTLFCLTPTDLSPTNAFIQPYVCIRCKIYTGYIPSSKPS